MSVIKPETLTEEDIRGLLEENSPKKITDNLAALHNFDMAGHYRLASVLLPLVFISDRWHLVYTRRTETLPDHKGQVAFPGGAYEPGDENLFVTALREAEEEIGLLSEDVSILGKMEPTLTNSDYLITPIIGRVPWPYSFRPSPVEVSRIFTIPLSWLAQPENYAEKPFFHPRLGATQKVIYFHPYDGELLWGISARLTLDFLKIIKLIPI